MWGQAASPTPGCLQGHPSPVSGPLLEHGAGCEHREWRLLLVRAGRAQPGPDTSPGPCPGLGHQGVRGHLGPETPAWAGSEGNPGASEGREHGVRGGTGRGRKGEGGMLSSLLLEWFSSWSSIKQATFQPQQCLQTQHNLYPLLQARLHPWVSSQMFLELLSSPLLLERSALQPRSEPSSHPQNRAGHTDTRSHPLPAQEEEAPTPLQFRDLMLPKEPQEPHTLCPGAPLPAAGHLGRVFSMHSTTVPSTEQQPGRGPGRLYNTELAAARFMRARCVKAGAGTGQLPGSECGGTRLGFKALILTREWVRSRRQASEAGMGGTVLPACLCVM